MENSSTQGALTKKTRRNFQRFGVGVCVCVCFFFWFFGCVFFVFDEMKSSHWICWGFGGGLKKKAYFGSNPKRNPWAGCLH